MKKLLIFASLLFLIVFPVNANSSTSVFDKFKEGVRKKTPEEIEEYKEQLRERKDIITQKQTDRQEKMELRIHDRCDLIEERVQAKISRFEQHKDDHVARYQRVKAKLEEILSKLEDKGYDVSELKNDLETLDELIREYAQLYVDFIASLGATQDYACGESDGDFREALARSHELLKQLRDKRREIREFYRDEIREDIKKLREQARLMRQENLNEES